MLPIRLPDDHHQGLLSLGRKQVTEKCITAYPGYCITVLQPIPAPVFLYYSLPWLLYYCITAYTSTCFSVLLPMLVTVLLYAYASYCITAHPSNCFAVLLPMLVTVLQPIQAIVLLYYCLC